MLDKYFFLPCTHSPSFFVLTVAGRCWQHTFGLLIKMIEFSDDGSRNVIMVIHQCVADEGNTCTIVWYCTMTQVCGTR